MAVGLLKKLDTTTLLWAAAIVWHRRHVSNHVDADTKSSKRANRRFTTWTWSLDFNVKILDTLLNGSATSHFRSHLGCERRGLARALETLTT